jgi:outer membrane protein assembly factor BamD
MILREAVCYVILASAPGALFAQNVRQPDQVLYDKAVNDIQHHRYQRARLTLQTLVNTYEDSALMAPAEFAIADSWYREGGTHGLAEAEKESNSVIALFPNTKAAADARALLRKIQDARASK